MGNSLNICFEKVTLSNRLSLMVGISESSVRVFSLCSAYKLSLWIYLIRYSCLGKWLILTFISQWAILYSSNQKISIGNMPFPSSVYIYFNKERGMVRFIWISYIFISKNRKSAMLETKTRIHKYVTRLYYILLHSWLMVRNYTFFSDVRSQQ